MAELLMSNVKIVAAKKTAINKELDMIPVRIDEALRNKADISASEEKTKRRTLKSLMRLLKKLDEQKIYYR